MNNLICQLITIATISGGVAIKTLSLSKCVICRHYKLLISADKMTATMVITLTVGLMMMLVDGAPLFKSTCGSCCKIKEGNDFTFSTSPSKSGVFNITNFCGDPESMAEAYCDATTDGGGWLVIQRRKDGSVDFNRDWVDYEEGFGELTGELWYGLRPIHCLTNQGQWELRIDYKFTNGTKRYLYYKNFKVGPPSSQYQLTISGYSGYTHDPITQTISWGSKTLLNSMKFTTRDRDNDQFSHNCATYNWAGGNGGGWWYKACSAIKLNNQYTSQYTIVLNGQWYNLPFVEMKIRPTSCSAQLHV